MKAILLCGKTARWLRLRSGIDGLCAQCVFVKADESLPSTVFISHDVLLLDRFPVLPRPDRFSSTTPVNQNLS